jgi:peptide/nickel transport system permease protein
MIGVSASDSSLPPGAGGLGGAASVLAVAPEAGGRARFWRRFGVVPTIALAFIVILLLVAIFAPLVAPFGQNAQNYTDALKGPSLQHLLGTDELGRDVLSRLIFGTRSAFTGLAILVVVSGVVGTAWGLAAGFLGGWPDAVLMRIADTWFAFPGLVLALAVAGVLGASLDHSMEAIGLVTAPFLARLLRSSVMQNRRADYVLVARSLGVSRLRCAVFHVLPNSWAPAFVQLWLSLSIGLLTEAGLGYLGLSVQPPAADWGSMLAESYRYFLSSPLETVAPGVVITITCLALAQVGEGMRRVLIFGR